MIGGHTEEEIKTWVAILVRGVTLKTPTALQIRQHKSWIFLRASVPMAQASNNSQEPAEGVVELVISKCKDCRYTPASEIHFADFQGEWPPYRLMKELDSPQLVTVSGRKFDA